MGELIAVEGLDGAGKNTLVTALVDRWRTAGARVATFAFPRYGQSLTADLAAEALHGEHGDLAGSVHAMALLFALDRADAAEELRVAVDRHDVVITDRYVASNAAYSAARLRQHHDGQIVSWIGELEFGRLGLPVPDRHLWVAVSPAEAMRRATHREGVDAGRHRDAYERDDDLQHRVDTVYHELADHEWMSPWSRVTDPSDVDAAGVGGTGLPSE